MASRKQVLVEPPEGAQGVAALPDAGSPRQGAHVIEMQRRRLLSAVVELAGEGSVQSLSVAVVCGRAGVSRRTFYDLFVDREDCLQAVFEDSVESARQAVVQAVLCDEHGERVDRPRRTHGWTERIRAGLTTLLSLLDRDPGLAQMMIVHGPGLGPKALAIRGQILAQAATIIDEGRGEARSGREPPPLTAEGTVGAVLSVIHTRLLEHDPHPLIELAGSLTALIVHPYLGPAAARRELDRDIQFEPIRVRKLPADPFKDLPIRLTYRTALVLTSIARSPGSSSRQVADASGITDPGQISRLLTRLRTSGLIQDDGVGPSKGMARAWSLTERGEGILQATGQV
jgi:AcrR family transcriptional regulator/DNA-binding MarR family transcriptional regulator